MTVSSKRTKRVRHTPQYFQGVYKNQVYTPQANSTRITMGEEVMLIDAGNEKDGKYIVQFLKAQGIYEIDYLIETHSDDDHSGGIETIVNDLSVSNVYMPQRGIAKSEIKDKVSIKIFLN